MNQRRYKQSQSRTQGMLLPPSIEEYVSEDNPVRAIDVYAESLDLEALGFQHAGGNLSPGQPAYPPVAMLKLYLYGYLNRVRSSRRLEKETQRNLEVIWLLRGLKPSYKTIADFRKDNPGAIKAVNTDFLALCQELGLFGGALVGIDGSFFRANASKSSIYTQKRIQTALENLEMQIEAYLQAMDQLDQQEGQGEGDKQLLQEQLEALMARQAKQQKRKKKLAQSGEKQLSEVDADARLFSKSGQVVAGYNIQIAVDEKHKLLAVCEVTNDSNDVGQLAPMAQKAQEFLGSQHLQVVADTGYFNPQHLKDCLATGITPYVPQPDRYKAARRQGRFSREDFTYHPEQDCYVCPAGQVLRRNRTYTMTGRLLYGYASQAAVCAPCAFKTKCLPKKTRYRQISRWEHEQIVSDHNQRMAQAGAEKLALRAALAEHPFGTLKHRCGWTHFLLRGKHKVRAEMALLMLGYNLTRVLNILGMEFFNTYCRMRARKCAQKAQSGSQFQRNSAVFLFFAAMWGHFAFGLKSNFVLARSAR